jgi:hypothetical protein
MGEVDNSLGPDVPFLRNFLDELDSVPLTFPYARTVGVDLPEHQVSLLPVCQPNMFVLGETDVQERTEKSDSGRDDSFNQEDPSVARASSVRESKTRSQSQSQIELDLPPTGNTVFTVQMSQPESKNTTKSSGYASRPEENSSPPSQF